MNEPNEPPSKITSLTLLERLRAKDPDAWRQLEKLYGPLVAWWCRRRGLSKQSTEDVTQEVFLAVHKSINSFVHAGRRGSFRAWLRGITQHKLDDHFKKRERFPPPAGGSENQARIEQFPDNAVDPVEPAVDSSERALLVRRGAELVRSEFEPITWKAFWKKDIERRSAAEVACELGISENAVFIACSRVRKRLKDIFQELLD